jgi:uncharacterized protein
MGGMKKIDGSIEIEFGGQRLTLLPDRAIYWPARETLLVADVHLGKGAAFRMAGVPVPSGNSAKDLKRLSSLFTATEAKRLVVLGDFIHARSSRQSELFAAIADWRKAHTHIDIRLVRGNHDRHAGKLLLEWNMLEVEPPCAEDGFHYAHFPDEQTTIPTFCGHVHPTFSLRDFDGSSASIACFVVDPFCLTLPSFGSFTGGHCVANEVGRRLYVTTGKIVLPVPRQQPP